MATYLRGLTDAVPQITPYQPDFGMIQKTLATMQSRYDRGFASVQNVYNQVLNAPLSDSMNKATRDSFLMDAERRLKDISSVDLSLPENQATAENVFAPFWEDDMILQDASLTKWYQGEISKALSTRDSLDDKIRGQYSDVAVRYLQNGLEKLQSAGRDAGKYAQLEKRRFVPFQNMKTYLNEQADKTGLKVVWESDEGPYLVKREGGVRAVQAFETFAADMLGDQFQDQFRVMGVVDKEERIRQMKLYNPALTDQQAMAEVAKSIGTEYKKGLGSRLESLQKQFERVTQDMVQYTSEKQLDTKQGEKLAELATQQLQLKDMLDAAKEQVTDTKTAEFQNNILSNPDSYFTSVIKQRAIKGWANARAASEHVSIGINPVWKENNDVSYRQRQLELSTQEVALKTKQYELNKWIAEHPYAKQGPRLGGGLDDTDFFGSDGFSGSGGSTYGGSGLSAGELMDPEKAGRFESLGSTDVTKTGNPYQLFQERQMQRWGVAHNELFGDKSGGMVLNALGVPTRDAVKYLSAMRKYSMDLSGQSLSREEQNWLHDLTKKLTGKDVPTHTGFFQLRTKLLDNMRSSLENKLKDGGSGFKREDADMLFGYMTATQAIQEHDALEDQRKRLIQQQITNDPKTYNKILTRKNGQYDVSDVDDIVKDFKPIKLRNLNTRKTETLNARQFAELYVNGEFNYSSNGGKGEIFIGGQKYYIDEFDGKTSGLNDEATRAFNNFYFDRSWNKGFWQKDITHSTNPNALEYKYGSSQDQKALRNKLNEAVVPGLPEYQSQTGKMGFVVRYDLAAKGKEDVATHLIQEASQAANHLNIYVNGKLSKDDDVNKAVMRVMKLGERDLKDYVSSALIKTVGASGRPSLEVVMQPVKSSDKTNINEEDLKKLAGLDTIEFELNPDASGETLRKIRYNSGMYVYGSLLRGKPLAADPMLAAAGFSFDIVPNDPNNPTRAIVEVKRKEFQNGTYKDVMSRYDFDFSRITPDELVNNMYSFAAQQFDKNQKAQQYYQQQLGQTKNYMTPDQVLQMVRKKYGR